mmetsp:Transcript_103489/g.297290  ORF Transcript_103489/g.297290 Transcript_103489/m.297290 type:complete len:258 (+) Transcript_103489:286-1059(+)
MLTKETAPFVLTLAKLFTEARRSASLLASSPARVPSSWAKSRSRNTETRCPLMQLLATFNIEVPSKGVGKASCPSHKRSSTSMAAPASSSKDFNMSWMSSANFFSGLSTAASNDPPRNCLLPASSNALLSQMEAWTSNSLRNSSNRSRRALESSARSCATVEMASATPTGKWLPCEPGARGELRGEPRGEPPLASSAPGRASGSKTTGAMTSSQGSVSGAVALEKPDWPSTSVIQESSREYESSSFGSSLGSSLGPT